MRRIVYRKVLPVGQLALYLVLVWYGWLYRQTWQAQFQHWITSRPAAADEWIPTWVDGPASLAEQLAFGINAPAVFVATLILIPFDSLFHNGASHELAAHAATAFFVPLLWYFIGRQLERRGGLLAHASMARKILAVTGLVAATLVAIFMAANLVVRFPFPEPLASHLFILAWAIIGALVSSTTIFRWNIRATAV